ncbi:MAG: UvrD-helicase domain-containing protein [Chloroflexota bacterium]
MSKLLAGLNLEQAQAVQTIHGPVLVLAGPGSGKTRVLTNRIAYLIEEANVAPWQILAVTFTNKAAREMRERVEVTLEDRFGPPLPGQPARLGGLTIGTFHSICARILRVETDAIGYARNWVIYDTADQRSLIRGIMRDLNIDEKLYSPNFIKSHISKQKNELVTPRDHRPQSYPHEIAGRVYTRYQEVLLQNNAMDFDDLLMKSTLLMRQNIEVRAKYQQKWQYILVDEFQDTNSAQFELIRMLANKPHGQQNVFAVGDEDQCVVAGTLVETADGPKPIEQLQLGDSVIAGAGHGSCAMGKIDAIPKRQYDGPVVVLETKGGRRLTATPEHCVFGRFAPHSGYNYVYLMYSKALGYRIGRTGSTRSVGKKAYPGFMERLRQERGDAIWLLKACTTTSEAAYWESLLSAQYSLPTACFYASGRRMAMGDKEIRQLFQDLDTRASAVHLADDLGISLEHPHHVPQATIRGKSVRKTISLRMFGSMKKRQGRTRWTQMQDPWHLHELSICSSDDTFREQVGQVLPTKCHKNHYWAARRNHGDYDHMEDTLSSLQYAVPDARIWRRAKLTQENFDFMPIGHLVPGAIVPVIDAQNQIIEDEIVSVSRQEYSGYVYDLSVPTYRNYAAGGIVVHNSIYRFRGADYRNVRNFRHEYPDAKVILLEQNYRSTQMILDVANAVIEHNVNRTPKRLRTENGKGQLVTVYEAYNAIEEAAWVCDEIERLVGSGEVDWGDCAIMYRTNAQSRALEEVFVTRSIKHKLVGATRFYERKEIKDALAYLRLVHNPADSVAMDRIINEPTRGIGVKTYSTLKSWAAENSVTMYEALLVLRHGAEGASQLLQRELPPSVSQVPAIQSRGRNALVAFTEMLESWLVIRRNERYESVADLMDLILDEATYIKSLRDGTDEGEERFANLQELRGVAAQYKPEMADLEPGQTPLTLMLEEVSLVSDADQLDEGSGAVTLMTLHTAKGLEYPVVFIVGMEDGILPHIRSIESGDLEEMAEERRLYYVGITRAEKRLYLVHAFKRNLWGEPTQQVPSRFLDEVPAHLLQGMVDRHSRQEVSYHQATSWDSDWSRNVSDDIDDEFEQDYDGFDEFDGSEFSEGTQYKSGKSDRQHLSSGSQTYWSPTSDGSPSRERISFTSSRGGRQAIRRPDHSQNAEVETQFKRGENVQHESFGTGTIIESLPVSGDEEVTIAFPGVGVKKLLASVASLKKVSE